MNRFSKQPDWAMQPGYPALIQPKAYQSGGVFEITHGPFEPCCSFPYRVRLSHLSHTTSQHFFRNGTNDFGWILGTIAVYLI